ncbi:MAG: translation initiation factor IF-2 [Ruminococcaceae bacterium]|nr:translation initiation factor IF-2 [Oscillospiraceae bacterium]
MSADTKNKINTLAKDFGVKSKDLVKIFEDNGMDVKNRMSALRDEEVNFAYEYFSKATPVEDIDKYLSGEIKVNYPDTALEKKDKKPDPAKEEKPVEKPVADKKASEEKVPEKKQSANKQPEKMPANAEKAAHSKDDKKPAAQQNQPKKPADNRPQQAQHVSKNTQAKNDRPAQQVHGDRPPVKKPEPQSAIDKFTQKVGKSQPQQQNQPKKPAEQQNQPKKPQNTINRTAQGFADVTKNVRVVDTRGTEVDLSKYDDKLLDHMNDGRRGDNDGGKQKFKKNNGRPDRKPGFKKKSEPIKPQLPSVITLPDQMIVSDLARELHITTAQVVKKLMTLGMMVTLNQSIDFDTAAIVADEFGVKAEKIVVVTIEEKLIDEHEDTSEELVERSPVVCVMGHVDHGKTSLLDAIRHANVTAGEAGGITQHIGAYRVSINGKDITFLDTPGHEAFTAMRARGAQATDIAILVVAADDGIMPQTIEAINHAKAAGVSIIVAINKIDKPAANVENVKTELTKYELVPEEWGGDVICVPVSAVTKQGIDDLLENVLLVAEVAELKANPNRAAKGIVIEAKLDKGRGPVATVLVQNGTLHAGDTVIAGTCVGRIRAMTNDKGETVKEAGPSVPVEILGLSDVPGAGDIFNAVSDERMARELAQQRRDKEKEEEFMQNSKVSLDDLFNQIKDGVKELNIIVKADVQGSAEAVKASLEKISNEEVRVRVIHSGVGAIRENDVMLAAASNAIIVGFNVRPDKGAIDSAERQQVDMRTYRIIYECIEEITAAINGMLAPKFKEVILGTAEVRQTIHVPNVGTIAGSYVTDGKVTRNAGIRIVRDGIVIFEDKISSLRRFKDDVKEVAQGYECGIGLEKYNDIKIGDVFEAFMMEEIKAGE